jgi:hypothetical protein
MATFTDVMVLAEKSRNKCHAVLAGKIYGEDVAEQMDRPGFDWGGTVIKPAQRAFRRVVVPAVVAFIVIGLAANVMTVVSASRNRDQELIRSTDEVTALVSQIYAYRLANGRYPLSLAALRPIPGDVISNHVKNDLRDDDDYCATWCWTYHSRGDLAPPILSRPICAHATLRYEFAPSSGYCYPKNFNDGWIVTDEGSKRCLKSFSG